MQAKETTDLDLLHKAARGDGPAFHTLVDRHARGMYALAASMVGNRADAEDVVQEAFAGAFKGLAGFEGRASVKTWLTRILVRQVARWRRDRRGRKDLAHGVPLEAAESVRSGGGRTLAVESSAPAVDRRLDLDAMLAGLSADHRDVIVLREIRGLSYEEIAEALDLPRGTVESRLHRARQELRERLRGYGA